MKTVQEQISNKCIHFNGLMNDACKAGINYADVRFDRPYKLPCLNQGGQCDNCKFPSAEELEQEETEMATLCAAALTAYAIVKKQIEKSGNTAGKIDCQCGGTFNYIVSEFNQHITGSCSACGVSFRE